MSLTPNQVQLIKATVPILQAHGNTITTVFYKNMLTECPELNDVFNTANQVTGHQPRALAGALFAYASNIDNVGALAPAVELIGNKHASLYIRPDDYKIVGKYLLEAMKEVLGEALTPEIHEAWAAAYWQLANILIDREDSIYQLNADWADWRDFRIANKVVESEEITSFYLKPVDGKPLPMYRPGQYISVSVHVPHLDYLQARQYSLSDMPRSDYYRISVKREAGLNPAQPGAKANPGFVSNVLHADFNEGDVIKVSAPCGDFFLSDLDPSRPVVLLAAGVGLTPLTAILNTLTANSPDRHAHFVHGARSSAVRAFKSHVESLEQKLPNVHATFFTGRPSATDKPGVDYHHTGRIDLAKLDPSKDLFLDEPRTEYYICGPESFMTDMATGLKNRGVSMDRVKMELFGAGGVPMV